MKRACLLVAIAACGDDTGPPDARRIDAEPPGGTVSLTWAIEDTAGNPVTCATVGASSVSLTLVPTDQPFGVTDVISCATLEGTSREIAPGRYNVAVSLAGVAADPVMFPGVVVESGQDTPLGNASFAVVVEGGFEFRIVAGTSGSNCAGGAGVTTVSIALSTVDNTCVPVTFDIAAGVGGDPAGTYTTDCGSPAAFNACIEADQTISVAPTLPSGTYKMAITAFVGADACWTRNPQFDVPAGGDIEKLLPQNLNLDTTIAACN